MSDLWAKAIQQTTNALSANDILPNEKLIGNILRVYASVLGLDCDTDEYREAVRRLRDMFLAKIPEGTTLTDNGETNWREWLPEMKQDGLVPQRWFAYQQYLQEKQNADFIQLQSLDKSTDRVLGLLSDPRRDHAPIRRKGLILGDVQSGKTRTYMALMNKAVDYGYKMIVVLTSSDEGLRRQTQERIDSDFLGIKRVTRESTGIGKYTKGKSIPTPVSLTNEDDFTTPSSKAFQGLPRPTWNDRPVITVMKKNGIVLGKFNKWLDSPEFPKDLPMLIIDDESDYASVNSAKEDESPTAINGLLRTLCNISERSSYVAVTATPFANVFIDDEVKEDLFPRDFIHILPTPPAYIGAKKLFGDLDTEGQKSPCVQLLDEDELSSWLPLSHKKEYRFDNNGQCELNPQVAHAIDCFLIACVLRPGAEDKRQSMLIHLSRFTAVQEQIADMINKYVGDIVSALKFHPSETDQRIYKMHRVYDEEYSAYGQTNGMSWQRVLHRMRLMTERLQVRLVNSTASKWSEINQVPINLAKNECTLYVGGNRLSRGMTLDGLICSVFYRNVTSADTLLQMGRWFGYRPGYADLQRVWLTDQSIADFRYACSITENLKTQAKKMERQGQTPKQFGLAIMKNPEKGVRITSATKMRSAEEGSSDVLANFDLEGTRIEAVRISAAPDRLKDNDSALNKLITECNSMPRAFIADSPMRVYRHIPAGIITEFLSHYRAGYDDTYFGRTLLQYRNQIKELNTTKALEFAKTQQTENPDIDWNIAFISGKGEPIDGVRFHWTQVERKSTYDREHDLFRISGKSMRLAGTQDVFNVARAISPVPMPKKMTGSETDYYLTKYFGISPTLMLYRVQIKQNGKKIYPVPDSGNGVLAAKLVIPTAEITDDRHRGNATYYYNKVATRQQYRAMREQYDANNEGGDEDWAY